MSKKTRRREKEGSKQVEKTSRKVQATTPPAPQKSTKKEQREAMADRPTPSREASVPATTGPATVVVPPTAASAAGAVAVSPATAAPAAGKIVKLGSTAPGGPTGGSTTSFWDEYAKPFKHGPSGWPGLPPTVTELLQQSNIPVETLERYNLKIDLLTALKKCQDSGATANDCMPVLTFSSLPDAQAVCRSIGVRQALRLIEKLPDALRQYLAPTTWVRPYWDEWDMIPNKLQQTIKARSEEFQGNTGLAEDSQRAIPSTGIDKSLANADDSWGAALAQRVPVDKTLRPHKAHASQKMAAQDLEALRTRHPLFVLPGDSPAERAEKNAAALRATLEIAERIDARNGTGPHKPKPASDKDKEVPKGPVDSKTMPAGNKACKGKSGQKSKAAGASADKAESLALTPAQRMPSSRRLAPVVGSDAVVLLNDVNLLLGPLCVLRHVTPLHSSYHVAADIKIFCNSTVLVQTDLGTSIMRMGPVTRKGPLALPAPKAALKANCAAAILQAATSADVQLEGEMETLMKSLVGGLFKTVPKQAKDHQVVEAAVVQIFDAATSAAETPAAELALYMASNYGNSPLLMHRLAARVVPDALRGAFKKHEGFRAVLPFVGTTATVYIGLQAWSFWEEQFLWLFLRKEVRAEKVIEAPGGNSELNLYLRPGAMDCSYSPPGTLYLLDLPQAAREPVISAARKLSLTAAVRAIKKMLHRDMKEISIVAILSKSVYIAVGGMVVSGAIVYALLYCCGSRLKGVPAVQRVLAAPRAAAAVILLPIHMACHMAAELAHGAGLRLQSVRQLLMQQAAIPPLLRIGRVEPPEKRTSPPGGRVIDLTAHAGALPAADSAGTARSLQALPARAAAWGAAHAAQAAVVAAGGLGRAAVMSMVAAEQSVRVASKPVEAIIGHKVTQAADFDGKPLPACPASVGAFRAGARMGYQVAGILSAIPEGLFKGALRLCSW